jgi:hypothetical protein
MSHLVTLIRYTQQGAAKMPMASFASKLACCGEAGIANDL